VTHMCAMLGVVTHRANHHQIEDVRPDGTPFLGTVRDAQGPPAGKHKARKKAAPPPEPDWETAPNNQVSPSRAVALLKESRPRKRRRARQTRSGGPGDAGRAAADDVAPPAPLSRAVLANRVASLLASANAVDQRAVPPLEHEVRDCVRWLMEEFEAVEQRRAAIAAAVEVLARALSATSMHMLRVYQRVAARVGLIELDHEADAHFARCSQEFTFTRKMIMAWCSRRRLRVLKRCGSPSTSTGKRPPSRTPSSARCRGWAPRCRTSA
jgi:hypothetical protein